MRLSQLQKRTLISEGWNDPAFTLFEQKTIQPWVADVERYVTEAALSKQQITQLFIRLFVPLRIETMRTILIALLMTLATQVETGSPNRGTPP